MNNGTWTVTLAEDPDTGELVLPFPTDFCEENDWQIDDVIVFTVNADQSCTITNKSWEERHPDEVNDLDEVAES